MPTIPVLIKPMPDELLFSYLMRLSRANGFTSFPYFVRSYLLPNRKGEHPANDVISYDVNTVYSTLVDSLNNHVDMVQFYLDHSIYSGIAPFMTDEQQTHTINIAFGRRKQFPDIVTKNNSMISDLFVCPECMKEDNDKYGFWYYHREHHMPGVHVCWKHHCALRRYAGTPNHEMAENAVFEESEHVVSPADIMYSSFSKDFLACAYQTDLNELARGIIKRVRELGYNAETYDALIQKYLVNKGLDKLLSEDASTTLKIRLISPLYVNDADVMTIMCGIFDDAKQVRQYLESPKMNLDFLQSLDGYDVYQPYRRTIIEMHCNRTNEDFVTTPAGFLAGWQEPSSDKGKTSQQKFSELVDIVGKGEYALASHFSGMDNDITLRRLTNENSEDFYKVKARAFIEEGVRYKDDSFEQERRARKIIESTGEFKLVQYAGVDKPSLIQHIGPKGCGRIFKRKLRKWNKNGFCPYCRKESLTEEAFKKDIQNLTGDEYTLMSRYTNRTTPVLIRHNICGQELSYIPIDFLDGQRCKYCSREITDKDFPEMISRATNGRYEIAGTNGKSLYYVKDTENIVPLQTLSKNKIIGEINRPTPSPVLPCEKRSLILPPKNNEDKMLEYLKTNYGDDDLIFLDDLTSFSNGKTPYKNLANRLCTKGFLVRIMAGVYMFHGHVCCADRVILERYIVRNGSRIGFYYGKSLAYKLGIVPDEPEVTYITTNKESQTHGRKVEVLGQKLRLQGSDFTINDDNYKILEALDVLHMAYHYGWKYKDAVSSFLQTNHIREDSFLPYLGGEQEHILKMLDDVYEVINR